MADGKQYSKAADAKTAEVKTPDPNQLPMKPSDPRPETPPKAAVDRNGQVASDPAAAAAPSSPAQGSASGTIPVRVRVARGAPHNGCWAIGRYFANGDHEIEVTEAQLRSLENDEKIKVLGLSVTKR